MLAIRLNRVGKKNKPYFRIVLQEHAIAPGGRHVEVLGSYDPHMKAAIFKADKIKYWISKGAQASDTVHNLLIKNGILEGDKRKVKLPAKKVEEVKEEAKKEDVPAEAKEELKKEEAPIEENKEEAPKAE